ncbi:MAG: biotin--[acetyl-CoA-carboxylase] ligase [Myxococcales bacterium]|nr:biotin--[acetyl-CoA-carboxylase] ligase [Myxococcales bacterium]MDH5567242.1 biotin--[acetyl-CoA-carboxylase] ligase [Myxococcales bacterium]
MSGGPARVLDALRRAGGRTCSGTHLASELGVSRAQVWKDVETLRARGYEIAGSSGGGYRLLGAPDRLYPEQLQAGLETRWLARDIRYFDQIDSTNRAALELAREGAAHGTCVVAEAQSAGRGRLGRSFFSPPYLNLYVSVVLRPDVTTTQAPAWILAATVAVADAVADTLGSDADVEIKWPNDVLLGGLKTSGILMELTAEATHVSTLVLGIGVNLNVPREAFPDAFRHLATSLASHSGARIDRIAFARCLFQHLETLLDACAEKGFRAVLPRFQARFQMGGRHVRVIERDGSEIAGTVRGIDTDGALLLTVEGGEELRVIAGDVTLDKERP